MKYAVMMNGFANLTQALTSRVSGYLLLLLLLSSGAALQAQQIEFPATGGEVPGAMHVVQKGETLFGIAKQYDTTPTEIKRLNGIDKATIYPGQMLVVSTKTATPRSAVSRSATPPLSSTPTSSLDAFASQRTGAYKGPSSLVAAELKILAESPAEARVTTPLLADAGNTRGAGSLPPVAPVSALPETVAKTAAEWYRVQEGDDIYSIADTYEVRPEDITAWNDGIRSVRPGDILMVRKAYQVVNRESLEQPASGNRYDTRSRSLGNLQMGAAGQATGNTEWGSSRGQELPTTASQTYRNYLSTAPAEYIGSREMKTGAAAKSETGKFVRFEYPGMEKIRFYAIHKSLPQGTKVKMGLPDNPGYIEVVIVGKLDYQADAVIGLSPACLQVLEGAGNPKNVTIAYD